MSWLDQIGQDLQALTAPTPIPDGMAVPTQQQVNWVMQSVANDWVLFVVFLAMAWLVAWTLQSLARYALDLVHDYVVQSWLRRSAARRLTPAPLEVPSDDS